MKDFGIIIPHYNSVRSAIKLLKSITADDISLSMEVILIDDRSTDNIDELIKFCSGYSNINFLKNDSEKKGAGVCRNIGLTYLENKTKWIMFADSDDYFEQGFGGIILDAVEKYNKCDLIYFSTISRDIVDNTESNRHEFVNSLINNYLENPSEINKIKLRFEHIVPWGKLIKSNLIFDSSIQFDEVMVSNDVMFSTKTAAISRNIAAVREVIYCITKSSGSLTTTMSSKNYEIRTMVQLNRYTYLRDVVLTNEEWTTLAFYAGKWLIEGLFIYQISWEEILKYVVVFKKNKIKISPPFSKILRMKKLFKVLKTENKYKVNEK